jgi:predicted DNA-binding transcriptional regulator AlpA
MSALANLPPDLLRRRVITIRDAAAMCGLSTSTFRRMRTEGTIPSPLRLSERRIGWRIGDLLDWQDCREAGHEWKDCRKAA